MSSAMTDAEGVEAPNNSAARAQFRTPDLLTRSTVLRRQIYGSATPGPERPLRSTGRSLPDAADEASSSTSDPPTRPGGHVVISSLDPRSRWGSWNHRRDSEPPWGAAPLGPGRTRRNHKEPRRHVLASGRW